MVGLLSAVGGTGPAAAAGWNPQGETQQLEAAEAAIATFKATDSGLRSAGRSSRISQEWETDEVACAAGR
jgi:hypothetical protein